MSALRVALHKEAIAEARAAREWYEVRSVAAAEAFMEELDRIVARIGEYPEGGAPYLEGTRRYLMQRFPHSKACWSRSTRRPRFERTRPSVPKGGGMFAHCEQFRACKRKKRITSGCTVRAESQINRTPSSVNARRQAGPISPATRLGCWAGQW
jgi:plasmid stabilization system protein ParE